MISYRYYILKDDKLIEIDYDKILIDEIYVYIDIRHVQRVFVEYRMKKEKDDKNLDSTLYISEEKIIERINIFK